MTEEMSMEEQSMKAYVMEYLAEGLKIKLGLTDDKIEFILIAFDIIYDLGFMGGKVDGNGEVLHFMKTRNDAVREKIMGKLDSYKERIEK